MFITYPSFKKFDPCYNADKQDGAKLSSIDSDSLTRGPLEIGNLPQEIHDEYAIRASTAEPSIISDANMANRAQMLTIAPEFLSEIDKLFGFPSQHVPWASFPQADLPMNQDIFKRTLSTNLGTPDQLDDKIELLEEWYQKQPAKNSDTDKEFHIVTNGLNKVADLSGIVQDVKSEQERWNQA